VDGLDLHDQLQYILYTSFAQFTVNQQNTCFMALATKQPKRAHLEQLIKLPAALIISNINWQHYGEL